MYGPSLVQTIAQSNWTNTIPTEQFKEWSSSFQLSGHPHQDTSIIASSN